MRFGSTMCALLLLVLVATPVRAGNPIDDPVYVPVTQTISSEQLARAIRTALAHRGWVPGEGKPSYISATLAKPGSYTVKIGLSYTPHEVRISYLDSEGLGYDEATRQIRGNYNKWLRMLSADINTYLTLLATEPESPLHAQVVPVEAPPAVAPAATAPAAPAPAPTPAATDPAPASPPR